MLPTRSYRSLVAALLALHTGLVVGAARVTPWITDEPFYFKAGMALRHYLDWGVFEARLHGPLPFFANQLLAGWLVPTDSFSHYVFWGRLGMLPFTLLTALALTAMAERALDRRAAVGALALYAVDPTILANASLMTCDVAASCGTVVVVFATWSYLRRPTLPRLFGAGAALGLAFATKYFAFLLLPGLLLALLVEIARGFRPRLLWSRQRSSRLAALLDVLPLVLIVAGVAIAVLHTCYLWSVPGYHPGTGHLGTALCERRADGPPLSHLLRHALRWPLVGDLLSLLPDPFVRGVDFQLHAHDSGGTTVLGDVKQAGHANFFALSLAVKLPLPTLLLIGFGLLARRPAWQPRLRTLLGASIAVPLGYLSLVATMQMGIRYILPAVPLLHLLGGRGVAALLDRKGRARRSASAAVLAAAGGLLLWSTASNWPYYTSAFNPLAGSRPYLLFSAGTNFCWPYRHEDPHELAGVPADAHLLQPDEGPRLGPCVIFAQRLGRPDPRQTDRVYHWLRRLEPERRVGPWIVFDVTDESFARATGLGTAAPDWRGLVDLALARLGAGDLAGARECLRDNPDPDAGAARRAIELAEGLPATADTYAWALLRFNCGDAVLRLGQVVAPELRALAHFSLLQDDECIALMREVERRRPLDVAEASMLTWAYRRNFRLDEALALLDRTMPEAGSAGYDLLQAQRGEVLADLRERRRHPDIDAAMHR